MKKEFESVKAKLKNDIISSLNNVDVLTLAMIVDAYNRWNEDEKDGVDYIFNIGKPEDLICCIEGGMTAIEIANLYNAKVIMFMFGQNRETPEPLTYLDLKTLLTDNMDSIIDNVIIYPHIKEYGILYQYYVTHALLTNN